MQNQRQRPSNRRAEPEVLAPATDPPSPTSPQGGDGRDLPADRVPRFAQPGHPADPATIPPPPFSPGRTPAAPPPLRPAPDLSDIPQFPPDADLGDVPPCPDESTSVPLSNSKYGKNPAADEQSDWPIRGRQIPCFPIFEIFILAL